MTATHLEMIKATFNLFKLRMVESTDSRLRWSFVKSEKITLKDVVDYNTWSHFKRELKQVGQHGHYQTSSKQGIFYNNLLCVPPQKTHCLDLIFTYFTCSLHLPTFFPLLPLDFGTKSNQIKTQSSHLLQSHLSSTGINSHTHLWVWPESRHRTIPSKLLVFCTQYET